jgi:hypothetical protein
MSPAKSFLQCKNSRERMQIEVKNISSPIIKTEASESNREATTASRDCENVEQVRKWWSKYRNGRRGRGGSGVSIGMAEGGEEAVECI